MHKKKEGLKTGFDNKRTIKGGWVEGREMYIKKMMQQVSLSTKKEKKKFYLHFYNVDVDDIKSFIIISFV